MKIKANIVMWDSKKLNKLIKIKEELINRITTKSAKEKSHLNIWILRNNIKNQWHQSNSNYYSRDLKKGLIMGMRQINTRDIT